MARKRTKRYGQKHLKELSKSRLQRLRLLRQGAAPPWIIKAEQVAMVMNRKGKRYAGIGKKCSAAQGRLMMKHVIPLMNEGLTYHQWRYRSMRVGSPPPIEPPFQEVFDESI